MRPAAPVRDRLAPGHRTAAIRRDVLGVGRPLGSAAPIRRVEQRTVEGSSVAASIKRPCATAFELSSPRTDAEPRPLCPKTVVRDGISWMPGRPVGRHQPAAGLRRTSGVHTIAAVCVRCPVVLALFGDNGESAQPWRSACSRGLEFGFLDALVRLDEAQSCSQRLAGALVAPGVHQSHYRLVLLLAQNCVACRHVVGSENARTGLSGSCHGHCCAACSTRSTSTTSPVTR